MPGTIGGRTLYRGAVRNACAALRIRDKASRGRTVPLAIPGVWVTAGSTYAATGAVGYTRGRPLTRGTGPIRAACCAFLGASDPVGYAPAALIRGRVFTDGVTPLATASRYYTGGPSARRFSTASPDKGPTFASSTPSTTPFFSALNDGPADFARTHPTPKKAAATPAFYTSHNAAICVSKDEAYDSTPTPTIAVDGADTGGASTPVLASQAVPPTRGPELLVADGVGFTADADTYAPKNRPPIGSTTVGGTTRSTIVTRPAHAPTPTAAFANFIHKRDAAASGTSLSAAIHGGARGDKNGRIRHKKRISAGAMEGLPTKGLLKGVNNVAWKLVRFFTRKVTARRTRVLHYKAPKGFFTSCIRSMFGIPFFPSLGHRGGDT